MKHKKMGSRFLSLFLSGLLLVTSPVTAMASDSGFVLEDSLFEPGDMEDGAPELDFSSEEFSEDRLPFEGVVITRDLPEEEIIYMIGSRAEFLVVEAEGASAYQWKMSRDGKEFEAIRDAVENRYLPLIDTEGIFYYKVSITSADGTETESKTAKITVRSSEEEVPSESEAEDGKTGAEAADGEASVEAADGETGAEAADRETGAEAADGEASVEAADGETDEEPSKETSDPEEGNLSESGEIPEEEPTLSEESEDSLIIAASELEDGEGVLAASADGQETSEKPKFVKDLERNKTYENFSDAQEDPLTVTAEVSAGTLTYQWYLYDSYLKAEEIPGAVTDTFVPEPEEGGTYLYGVSVTNTEEGKDPVTVKSSYCTVKIAISEAPVFEENLANTYAYKLGEKAETMTVKASVSSGTLSYQWKEYVGSNEYVDITGETGPSYTPDVSQKGTRRYAVMVTNNDTDKDGRKKAPTTVSSNVPYVAVSDFVIEETDRHSDTYSYPDEMTITLPWGPESLESRVGLIVDCPGGYEDHNIKMTGDWYVSSTKNFEDAEYIEGGYASGIVGSNGEFARMISRPLDPTTVTGPHYYFVKVKMLYGEKEMSQRVFGPYTVTIQAPETIEYGLILGEESIGNVNIRISDTTPKRYDLLDNMGDLLDDVGPAGYLLGTSSQRVSVPVYPSDNMMTVIARSCTGWGLSQEGAENNYITKITRLSDGVSREEFQRGHDSGWMGSLNDWFTNEGFQAYSIENGGLKTGDNIDVVYTTDKGTDVGGSILESDDYRLKGMEVDGTYLGSRWFDQLEPAFDSDLYEYCVYTSGTKLRVSATPVTKQNKVYVYANGVEYAQHSDIIIEPGMTVEVVCASPRWVHGSTDPENEKLAKTYSVYLMPLNIPGLSTYSLAEDGSGEPVKISGTLSANEGSAMPGFGPKRTIPYSYKTINIGDYSGNPSENPGKVRLAFDNAQEGTEVLRASIAPVDALSEVHEFQNEGGTLSFTLDEEYIRTTGSRDYFLRADMQTEAGVIKYAQYIRFTKSAYALGKLELEGNPRFGTTMLNHAPEGTLFQLDADGKETGATGFAQHVYRYNLYALPGITSVLPKSSSGLSVGTLLNTSNDVKTALYVDGEEVLTATLISNLSSQWYNADPPLVSITKDRTEIRIHHESISGAKPPVDYYIYVIQQAYDVSDLINMINALPTLESLEYARDYGSVNACRIIYEGLTDEQKAEMNSLSPEAVEKLEKACGIVDAQKEEGERRIQDILALVDTYKDLGWTTETVLAEREYTENVKNVRESYEKYNTLNDWVKEEFDLKYAGYGTIITLANKLILRYETKNGMTEGKAVNYEDDFMVSSNAYNLTLGAGIKDYPITFRDILYSNGINEGKPYNTPGFLQWEIEDESIVTIRTERTVYKDGGLGGGGSYDDERYYLIPRKVGTTVLTVNVRESKGNYFGQIPKIIIHVNSPDEASMEDAAQKLTNINDLPYTRKYDTWHFWEGTEGAPFTFHVNGEDGKVVVWPAGSTGEKTEYAVGGDGNVTVYLKDGYNPIEVSAVMDGKTITQVYGIRGKAISMTVENKYRTGQPLVKGDTAVIKLVGVNKPVHKILRIYNPWGGVIVTYTTTSLEGQGSVQANKGAGQYGVGYLELLLTSSGTVKLTNGHIEEEWLGSSLYSEADQGNTGGIAGQTVNNFSVLPDITLEVGENEGYQASEYRIHPTIATEGMLRSGDQVMLEISDLPVTEITDAYPFITSDTAKKFQSAQTCFATDLPGLPEISSKKVNNPQTNMPAETALLDLKQVSFTIPEDTPTGTYHITGGHVYARYGDAAWTVNPTRVFRREMTDLEIQVVNPAVGMHDCVLYGEWKITDPSCTEAGKKENICTVCGEVIESQETAPALGHTWEEWKTVSKATTDAREKQERSCSVCGEKETRETGLALLGRVKLKKAVSSAYNKITVTWKKQKDADGYYILRKRSGETKWKRIANVKKPGAVSYTDSSVVFNVKYTYTVRAYRNTQKGAFDSKGVSAKAVLPTVKLGTVKVNNYKKVTITWNKTAGATGYRVLRKAAGGKWKRIADLKSAGTVSYTDTKVVTGVTYTYSVRAYRTVNKKVVRGKYDRTGLTATPVPGRVAVRSVAALSDHSNTITWKSVAGADGYQIWVKSGTGKYVKAGTVKGGKVSFAHKGLKKGTKYFYKIRAFRVTSAGGKKKNVFGAYSTVKTIQAI